VLRAGSEAVLFESSRYLELGQSDAAAASKQPTGNEVQIRRLPIKQKALRGRSEATALQIG
jgi:hypothetical protein